MPMEEGFIFMKLQLEDQQREAERKRQLFWMNFLALVYSGEAPTGKNRQAFLDAQSRFINVIQPEGMQQKEYEWNIPKEVLEEAERARAAGDDGQIAVIPAEKGGKPYGHS